MTEQEYLARMQKEASMMRNVGMHSNAGMANCCNESMLARGTMQDDYVAWMNRKLARKNDSVRVWDDVQ